MSSRRFRSSSIVLLIAAVTAAAAPAQEGKLPQIDIERLVSPIALYPDVLISQILPAATFPTDIVQAARWCREHPDLKDLDTQKWDLSVISVCRYPQVLNKMDQDLDWTNALGAAFLDQQEDIMTAIQRLRDEAKEAGVLKSTSQQTVVEEGDAIRIVPAEKEIVYVPQYDPQVIYVEDDDDDDALVVAGTIAASALSFGAGMALGAWLDNDCDWHGGCVVACRPGYWGGYGYRGAVVAWDNDWVAARGARRGVVAGPNGGVAVGPRGAAVWGDNGRGAAWRRPTPYARPAYTGRYSSYNNMVGNRRTVASGNQVNINRNNVNIDRGDRVNTGNINRGNNTAIRGGDRVNAGNNVDRSNRPNAGNVDRSDRPNSGNVDRSNRPSGDRSNVRPEQRPSSTRQSTVGDRRSSSEVKRSSSRGSSSRGTASRGGGGGGGRRGR